MTLKTLAEVLQPAIRDHYAVPGLVCLGWEDMRAYVMAAQEERAPVILQAGPSCRAHTPLPVLGAMMRHLAASVDVPVVAGIMPITSSTQLLRFSDACGAEIPRWIRLRLTNAALRLIDKKGIEVVLADLRARGEAV